MSSKQSGPIVFQIGFNRCGTKYLTNTFEKNGYVAKHWAGGALAEDIAYSKAANIKPLTRWPEAVFFSDMESVHKPHRPPVLAFKEFEFLHSWFPDAVFILNKRNVSDWIASRFSHHGGQYKQFWAHHLNVAPASLPDIWRNEWEEHFSNVIKYFNGYDKFFIYDIDSNRPEDLVKLLSPWFDLPKPPHIQKDIRQKIRAEQKQAVQDCHPVLQPAAPIADEAFIKSVSKYCIGTLDFADQLSVPPFVSDIFGRWDGQKVITNKLGTDLQIKRGSDDRFHSCTGISKLERTESVVNELLSLGLHGRIQIDMQDSRDFGTRNGPKVAWPTVVYNRLKGAKNMVLWPLPGLRRLGQPRVDPTTPVDKIKFEDKLDQAVWRGNLSGRPNETLAPHLPQRRSAIMILESLAATKDEQALISIHEELMGLTRYNLVARAFMSNDIDALLTLGSTHAAQKSPLLSLFCGQREAPEWLFKSKYILCLSGFGTDTNFLVAASSNSVVMKEDDDWAFYYSNAFLPWKHYIPLASGALDVEEKLDWARANPKKCTDMIKNAQAVCAKFANPVNRGEILKDIFSALQYRPGF